MLTSLPVKDWGISIHAPAKGATKKPDCNKQASEFQSTLPRRERLETRPGKNHPADFNPRSREGSD